MTSALAIPRSELWTPRPGQWTFLPKHLREDARRGPLVPDLIRDIERWLGIAKAITGASLTNGKGFVTSGTSVATGTMTPTANRLLLVNVISAIAFTTPNTPTLSGGSLTYNTVTGSPFTYSITAKSTTFWADLGASPGSFAVTASFGGQSQTAGAWILCCEFGGVDIAGGPIVQEKHGTGSSSTAIATGSFASGMGASNGAAAVGGSGTAAVTFTAGSGYTLLDTNNSGSAGGATFCEWRSDPDPTPNADCTGSVNNDWSITGVELKATSSGVVIELLETLGRGVGRGLGRGLR